MDYDFLIQINSNHSEISNKFQTPSASESKTNYSKFREFLNLINEKHGKINIADNQHIRDSIKHNIPPLKNVKELLNQYEKSFCSLRLNFFFIFYYLHSSTGKKKFILQIKDGKEAK